MIHLGDITKIHGDKVEPVDCVTFGSPCQDLSIAGRRAGLAGERSGLFMEAVRIIKEMREATDGICPTFAIWENVPGAFSSNGGKACKASLFWYYDQDSSKYIGIDNTTGEAWTEEFDTKQECFNWLKKLEEEE